MNKKLLCILLVFLLLSNYAFAVEDIYDSRIKTAAETLQALGAINVIDGKYNPIDTISRGDFAYLVLRLINIETEFDLDNENQYHNIEKSIMGLGIMNGNEQGEFMPRNPVTYEQAVKTIISVLGYNKKIENMSGKYPEAYMLMAGELGITKNVSARANTSISKGDLAILIANSLRIPLLELSSFGSKEEYTTSKDTTILSKYHDTYFSSGVVEGNYYTMINEKSTLNQYEIMIDSQKYICFDKNMEDYLGRRVRFYYKDSDDKDIPELIYMYPENNYDNLYIDVENIASASLESIMYYNQSGKIEKKDLDKYVDYIYNGVVDLNMTNNKMRIREGHIILVDSNNDGSYDLVKIVDYKTIKVQGVESESMVITDTLGGKWNLDFSKKGKLNIINADNEIVPIKAINEGDVLTMLISEDNSKALIYQTNMTVSESVAEINEDNIVTEEGAKFILNKNFAQVLEVGVKYNFNLDYFGKIAFAEKLVDSDLKYGYLLKMVRVRTLGEKCDLKIYDTTKKAVIYRTADNFRINGVKYKREDIFDITKLFDASEVLMPQLIMYRTNYKDELTEINLYMEQTNLIGYDKENFTRDSVLTDTIYRSDSKMIGTSSTARPNIGKEERVCVDNDTIIFAIPDFNEKDIKEEDMTATDINSLLHDSRPERIEVYDMDERFVAKVLVMKKSEISGVGLNSFVIAESVVEGLGKEQEHVYRLKCYYEGALRHYDAETDTVFADVKKGDILNLTFDNYGYVSSKSYLVRYDNRNSATYNTANSVFADKAYILGTVQTKNMPYFTLVLGGYDIIKPQYAVNPIFYLLEKTENNPPNDVKISITTQKSMLASTEDKLNGSRVFIMKKRGVTNAVVVYKD